MDARIGIRLPLLLVSWLPAMVKMEVDVEGRVVHRDLTDPGPLTSPELPGGFIVSSANEYPNPCCRGRCAR